MPVRSAGWAERWVARSRCQVLPGDFRVALCHAFDIWHLARQDLSLTSTICHNPLGAMRITLALLLCFLAGSARADAFFKLVGYQCDKQSDRLVLTYDAAANGTGQSMAEAKTNTQWDPLTLVQMRDDDNIASTTTVRATCKLSAGVYSIALGPIPGNMNIQRRCGGWISAWAEVRLGRKVIFPRTDFESGVGCFYADGEITTRVEIAPGRADHKITRFPAGQLLSDTSDLR